MNKHEFMTIPDNRWDFLARNGINRPSTLPGHKSKINVQYGAAVVLALVLEYQHQLLIARRLLKRRKKRLGSSVV